MALPKELDPDYLIGANLRPRPRKDYDFTATDGVVTVFFAENDRDALKELAKCYKVSSITHETFAQIGGKHYKCGSRQVFPPLGNA